MRSISVNSHDPYFICPPSATQGRNGARIRTMIVGRHFSELQALQSILAETGTIEVIDTAESTLEALTRLDERRPELIVLDSKLPVETALEILERIPHSLRVIFGSVLSGIGFRAFDVQDHGSLLHWREQPAEDPVASIQKAKDDGGIYTEARPLTIDDPIILKLNDQYHIVRVRSILSVSSARHYTFVVTAEGYKGIASKSMKEWEVRLPGNVFLRIHRNTIINLEYVEHIVDARHATYDVYLKGIDKPISMSNRCFARIKRQLN